MLTGKASLAPHTVRICPNLIYIIPRFDIDYELHNKLFTLNLDATSFKNAATNLVRAADTKSDQANNSIPLLSEQTLCVSS